MTNFCESCAAERAKQGLPPLETVTLPADITSYATFKRPNLPTLVCPHCDGETLISTSLRAYQERQGK